MKIDYLTSQTITYSYMSVNLTSEQRDIKSQILNVFNLQLIQYLERL